MNTPAPVTPAPATGSMMSATATSAPTVGSILGTIVGLWATTKIGFNPLEVTGGSIAAGIAGLITAGFHWLGSKLKIASLG